MSISLLLGDNFDEEFQPETPRSGDIRDSDHFGRESIRDDNSMSQSFSRGSSSGTSASGRRSLASSRSDSRVSFSEARTILKHAKTIAEQRASVSANNYAITQSEQFKTSRHTFAAFEMTNSKRGSGKGWGMRNDSALSTIVEESRNESVDQQTEENGQPRGRTRSKSHI